MHVTISEIESYSRVFSVPDPESFAELVFVADSAVHFASEKVEEKKKKLLKLSRLKNKGRK